MSRKQKKASGQAIVEYIIIIVIVAVAALTVMGIFSDRLRTLIAGVASTLGDNNAVNEVQTNSAGKTLKEMSENGIDISNK
jgi:Flp pilus assembly pilin Flp